MSAKNYALTRRKAFALIALIFAASTIFAYILPKVDANLRIEATSLAETHPLTGISDNVVICGNDGSELHEIYLCGENDERLIETNITNLKQIVWAKLSAGSCSASQPNCANTSTSCVWDQLSTDTQYTINEEGEYRLFIIYNDNSSARYYFNVFANGLNPNALVTNIDCGAPGNITINNVPSSYEFSINNGATWQDSNVFTITSVSTYTVKLRRKNDSESCIFTVNDIAVINNSIDAEATVIPINCNNTKGGIKVDINEETSTTYIYEIRQGGNLVQSSGPISTASYTFDNLNSGAYDIEVKLASVSNCSWTATHTLPAYTGSKPKAVVTKNIDCTDGIITVTQNGGISPFKYSLDGTTYTTFTNSNKTLIPISTAGSYTVYIKDNSECIQQTDTVTLTTEAEIVYNTSKKDITCSGLDDGTITVNVTDTKGYSITYSKDGGTTYQTSSIFSNLSSGTYNIAIKKEKSGNSCTITHGDITIEPSPNFVLSTAITQEISCSNGSATIEATVTNGGVAPIEFSTDGVTFQSTSTFVGLGPGDYTLTAKDANGCTTTTSQTVSSGSNPSNLTFIPSNVDCSTGTADVQITVQDGKAPFTFKITAPSEILAGGDTFTALAPGTYTFEVTADDGCKIVRNYTVPKPIEFTAIATVTNNVSCASGANDGTIELHVNNFSNSFNAVVEDSSGTITTFGSTNNTTSPLTINGLPADTYTLRISDEASVCESIEILTIKNPDTPLTIDSFSVTNMNCGKPGSVTIEASGGWSNYTYYLLQPDNTYTAFQSNKTITDLTQIGTYTIHVKDVNGCVENSTTFEMADNGGPTATVDQSSSNYCYSTATKGVLKIDVTDGDAPFFYTLNNGTPVSISGGTFTLSNLTPEDYVIKIIGNNGCETVVEDTKIAGQLFALGSVTKPLGCGTDPDAEITVVPEQGYPPFTYNVDSGSGYTPAVMPFKTSTEGTFTFEVIDAKGCTFTTESIVVEDSPPMTTSTSISNTACGKQGTGSVKILGHGGTPPFTYSFNGSPFTTKNLYTGLDAISYTYSIRDALGCEILDQVAIVGAEAAITADIVKTDITCDPVNGGTQWGNTNVSNVQNATGKVTIKLIRVSSPAAHDAGTARYWTYREYNDIDMSAYPSGYNIRMYWPHYFYVEIEDEKGCIFESDVYEIEQPELPWVQKAETDLEQSCASGATFEVEVGNPAELVGPFKYRIWPYDEDNPPTWRSFEVASENEAYGEDSDVNGIERDFRVSGLLFGVSYAIVLYDENTGCQRWRSLGTVAAPEAPNNAIDVVSVPQSLSCYYGTDGKVQFTVKGADDFDNDGIKTVSWKIKHTSDYGQGGSIENYRQNGTATDGGTGGDVIIDVTDLRVAWYVVEVTVESGCKSGNRFLIYRPKTSLKLELDQYVPATCNIGAQIAVTAKGGWDDQYYFNVRNKLDQTVWHDYEYAFVTSNTDPTTITTWGPDSNTEVTPTAYDGTNNVYQVYVRDGGGCIVGLGTPITITKDAVPVIDKIDVTNRCTSTNELYNVVATLSNLGTSNDPLNLNPKYIWDGVVTSSATKQLGPGNHTLVVRDNNGCSATESIFIYPQLVPKIAVNKTLDCDTTNPENGELIASAYGGSGTYSFTLSPIPASYAAGEETNTTGIFDRLTYNVDYKVTVTDIDPQIDAAERCPSQDSPTLRLEEPATPNFTLTDVQHVSCNGANDGVIVVTQGASAENLDVPYEYSIDGGTYQTSNLFNGLAAGSHTITIRSAKNCIQTIAGIQINQPTVLTLATPTVFPFYCTGTNALGMATVGISTEDLSGTPTGTAPYYYSFNGSSFSNTSTYDLPYKTTPQAITINVVDANGCTDQTTVTVPAATKVTAVIDEDQTMNCDDDALIEVLGNDGSGNYEVRELPSGDLINGTGNGTITISAGTPGTYIYELTDTTTGCTSEVTYKVEPFDTIEVTATKIKDINCFGDANGELQFEVTGYTGPFSYDIYNTNAPGTSIETGTGHTDTPINIATLPAGTFFVITDATDVPKCEAESNRITIQSPSAPLDFNHDITKNLTCTPGNDAQVTALATGGWAGYEFELIDTANPSTPIQAFGDNNVFSDLQSGITYQITVRDSGTCTVQKTFDIPVIDPIIIDPATITVTQPTCPGIANASISVVASRVNGPTAYEYILNNTIDGVSGLPQTSNTFNNLAEGEYSVTATDGRGCDVTTDVIKIIDPEAVIIDAAITKEPSCTPNQGEIVLSATGGSGSFEYSMVSPTPTAWSIQNIFSDLGPGTYEFLARDANNLCVTTISVIRTIVVVEPLTISVNEKNTLINCNGETDAVLVALAQGGLGGYAYQLEKNGSLLGALQDNGTFTDLGAGSYRIRSTSGIDCEVYSDVITITQPNLLEGTANVTQNVLCFGETNGAVTILPTGGVSPYLYTISSAPQKATESPDFTDLGVGTYTVVVQDTNGCEIEVSFEISGPTEALAMNVSRIEDEICSSDDDGLIELTITGGTAPYKYSVQTADNSGPYLAVDNPDAHIINNLDAGSYLIYIKDANGCSVNEIQTIAVGADLTASHEVIYDCKEGKPYTITEVVLKDQDIKDEVLYALNSDDANQGQYSAYFENLPVGTHYISIIHKGGCIERIDNIVIDAPDPLILTLQNGNINEILVEASGGNGKYTYFIDDMVMRNGSYYITESRTYAIRVEDELGCIAYLDVPMEFIDIEIPEHFTPDGNGDRDLWSIKNWEAYPDMYTAIYDRYGRQLKVFVGEVSWDGTYEKADLPTGDYWYIIRLRGERDTREFVGHVTIYR